MTNMQNENLSLFNLTVSDFKKLIAHTFSEHFPKREKEKSLPKLLTMSEVMIHFSITKPTIYKWVKFNILPEPLKIGGLVYFRKEDVELMIANNK